MKLRLTYPGIVYRLFAVELDNGRIPAHEFMAGLEARDKQSHKRMVYVYKRHADVGKWTNKRVSRPIKNSDQIFEWKIHKELGCFISILAREPFWLMDFKREINWSLWYGEPRGWNMLWRDKC